MDKIKTIIRKEWAEVFKNRMVLFTTIFLPLFFAVLPLIILYTMRDVAIGTGLGDVAQQLPAQMTRQCGGLSTSACMQVYIVTQFMMLFMMIPLIIPINIAAYSIVGEKTTRSLEPLLATPITTAELLVGKNLAAVIPAVLATYASFILFGVGALLIVGASLAARIVLDPMWLLAVFLVGPLMSVLSVNFSLIVSSRVNDPRVAEQISTMIILPVLALFFGQVSGLLIFNSQLVLTLALAMIVLDGLVTYVTVRLFQRETILTRWK